MLLVVDANVAISAIISNGINRRLFFDERLRLSAPTRLAEEVTEYTVTILAKGGSKERIAAAFSRIRFVSVKNPKIFHPDPDDSDYIALAHMLDCPLWSNDKALKQADVPVLTTAELAEILRKR